VGAKLDLPPPPTVTESRGGGSGWVEVARARDDIEAHLLEGRLNEAGIETRAITDRNAPGAWLYGGSNPWAPVTILVRRMQLEDARVVMAEISLTAPDAGTPERSDYPPTPWKWWLLAVGLGVVLAAAGMAQIVYRLVADL
jgi:putative signal transducing protein